MSIDFFVFKLPTMRRQIVLGIVIGHAGFFRVHVGAAEIFGGDNLAGRRLHQRRAAEEDGALVTHDDGLVRHRRHVGAARGAGTHNHRNLRDARGRQRRLIVENAAEMLAIGKDVGPLRQVGTAGIDEIDARQPVLARNFLCTQMLLYRQRIVGAPFDRGVIADNYAFAPEYPADAGNDAGGANGVLVHAVGGKRRQFKKRRTVIDQRHHALARQELSPRKVTFPRARRSTLGGCSAALLKLSDKRAHGHFVGGELRRCGVDVGFNCAHESLSWSRI
jgi:hypothetical protein